MRFVHGKSAYIALGALFAVVFTVSLPAFSASAGKPLITLDDMLHAGGIGAEGTGGAVFSPDGHRFAYALRTPIADQDSWGYAFAGLLRERVFVSELHDSSSRELVDTKAVRYALPFMPPGKIWARDSRGLLLLASTQEGYGLAYADVVSGKITTLPGRPNNFGPAFDWVGADRVAYAVLASGVPQPDVESGMLQGVDAKWHAAWYGEQPQVTVSSANPVFKTSHPPEGELLLANVHTGASKVLTKGNYLIVSASPDGRYIAALRQAEPVPHAFGFVGDRTELQIFELTAAGGHLVYQAPDLDVAISGFRPYDSLPWSSSGDQLLVMGKPAMGSAQESHLYVLNVSDGKRRELATSGLSFINPGANAADKLLLIGWMGNQPVAVASHPEANAKAAPHSPGAVSELQYGESSNLRYDVYALGSKQPQNLTAFSKTSVKDFLVLPGSASLLVVTDGALWQLAPNKSAEQLSPKGVPPIIGFGTDHRFPPPPLASAYTGTGANRRIALYAMVEGKPQREILDLTQQKLIPLKPRGEVLATAPNLTTTLNKLRDGWTSSLLLDDGGSEHTVATVNASLKDKAVAPIRSFQYKYGGKSLTGWVVLPPGTRPGAHLPAVVSVYGGLVYGPEPPSYAQPETDQPIFSDQLLAAQGYAVILPSTPLGQGATTDVMATLAGETVAAIDALAKQGVVDPERVGVMGQSFGGFSTAAILVKRSDRFKAGIAMAGIYGWIYGWGIRPLDALLTDDGDIVAPEIKLVENGQSQLLKPFWEAPEAYMRNSPIFHVENLNTPLLLLHGDLDMGVTGLPNAIRLYNALLRAGKKPALVRYWGEGHVAQSAWAIRDQWQRITTWFGHYLRKADGSEGVLKP